MTAPFAPTLASDAGYVSPSHLRTPLRSFLVSHDKGIYWLRMPADTGKSEFIRGIVARRPGKDGRPESIDSAISSGMHAVAVALEPGDGAPQLVAALKSAFDAEFGPAGDAQPPQIRSGDAAGARADFAAWLGRLADLGRAGGGKRLLLCIDGLEVAAAPGEGGAACLLDLLPDPAQVPDGLVLLLTSRPGEDWPDGAFAPVAARFAGAPAVAVHDVGLADASYVESLQKLFRERLRPVLRARSVACLKDLLEAKAAFEKGGRDARLTNDPVLRDGLKDDWKKLTNKYPRYSGQLLPVAPLVPLLDQFDRLWTQVMDRGEQRFRYVRMLIDHIVDGTLAVEEVAALPAGTALATRLAPAA
ncbi:hypothetical protein EZH22_20230 [Xanthobacter dioxanivorans]|uniref:Uncharacterized protein n=1 Tax=Xanthobacter dioxanivorans TaxID=2528964 RepID=A0A974SGM0_9HYPH|nr:hypothetical protein [Xanthobacter dioxanivorans]QRG05396.1 hypothetical protein EZH22_20230 [Xanthobacter dioxanivorans]